MNFETCNGWGWYLNNKPSKSRWILRKRGEKVVVTVSYRDEEFRIQVCFQGNLYDLFPLSRTLAFSNWREADRFIKTGSEYDFPVL